MKYSFSILEEPFLERLPSLAKKQNAQLYVVGGFIRDALLVRERDMIDIDFAVSRNAIALARSFAKITRSGFVVLDREHGCARVLYKHYTLDFTDYRGTNLKEDLLHRDFTINTLALKFPTKNPNVHSCIDYYGGLADLKKRIVRMVSPASLHEDYIRILRAFSLSATFGCRIESKTRTLAKKLRKHLLNVAGERVRDELFKIFAVTDSHAVIEELDTAEILSCVITQIECMKSIAQGPYHHLDVWKHSLETLKQFEQLYASMDDKDVSSYLREFIAGDRRRFQLIKLVCLLHDVGKPQTLARKNGKISFHGHERIGKQIAKLVWERLKLSTREKFAIDTMIFWHLRPGYLSDIETISARATFRYFRDTAEEAVSILLLAIADQRATRGPLSQKKSRTTHEQLANNLIQEYFHKKHEKKFMRLINGTDLIRYIKIKPSPIFKTILEEVEEAQAEGSIRTKQQALALARKIAKQHA